MLSNQIVEASSEKRSERLTEAKSDVFDDYI